MSRKNVIARFRKPRRTRRYETECPVDECGFLGGHMGKTAKHVIESQDGKHYEWRHDPNNRAKLEYYKAEYMLYRYGIAKGIVTHENLRIYVPIVQPDILPIPEGFQFTEVENPEEGIGQ